MVQRKKNLENRINLKETPKNPLRHCGLDPQSLTKMLLIRGLRVKPAMTGIQKNGVFRSVLNKIMVQSKI